MKIKKLILDLFGPIMLAFLILTFSTNDVIYSHLYASISIIAGAMALRGLSPQNKPQQ